MATVAYLRVSTESQTESGAGLAAQLDACGQVDAVFTDAGVSGATGLESRPALLEAIATLSKGDVLIVAKRDRLGRDPIAVAMIERAVARRGARIVSAAGEGTDSDSPSDVLMRRMVDAFAEYERLLIGARTKAALQAKRTRNERTGSVPFGKALAVDLVHIEANAAEQAVIVEARALRGAGLSLRAVANELAKRGLVSRNGKAFEASQVKRMVAA